jgi:hypothetical protein
MSNSIIILKQIIDLLYEDYLKTINDNNATKSKLLTTETELDAKNKEFEAMYTENIKLSNLLSRYEADIETLANIISENPKKTPEPKVEQTPEKESPKVCARTVIIEKTPEKTEETPNENPTENKKKPRTDYMREYQRAYRKKKREENISMNV